MPVMGIGKMRMAVKRPSMNMRMAVLPIHRRVMLMLMVAVIMGMEVIVADRFMQVIVFVMFGQMQPNAKAH